MKITKTETAILENLVSQFGSYLGVFESILESVGNVKEGKQEDFDNKSEKWQESEKGEAAQLLINEVENLFDQINESFSAMQQAIDQANDILSENF